MRLDRGGSLLPPRRRAVAPGPPSDARPLAERFPPAARERSARNHTDAFNNRQRKHLESFSQLTVHVRNRGSYAGGGGGGLGQGPRSVRSQFGSPCRHGAGRDRDEVPRAHQSREAVPSRDLVAISRDLVTISSRSRACTPQSPPAAATVRARLRGRRARQRCDLNPGDAISHRICDLTPEMRSASRLARPAADLASAAWVVRVRVRVGVLASAAWIEARVRVIVNPRPNPNRSPTPHPHRNPDPDPDPNPKPAHPNPDPDPDPYPKALSPTRALTLRPHRRTLTLRPHRRCRKRRCHWRR